MPHTPTPPPSPDGLTVLYQDPYLLALIKPPGLLTVPGRGPERADCLIARAQQRWPDALIVHRLDQATSGLLLLARGATVQRALSQAFAERRIHKRYEALVHGHPPWPETDSPDWADIALPLIVDWPRRPRSKVDPVHGKPSHTRWRPLPGPASWPGATRLALQPITGRSHQLRVHLMALSHPILGDTLYGPPDGAPRLMLHACMLQLQHPITDQPIHLHSPAPF